MAIYRKFFAVAFTLAVLLPVSIFAMDVPPPLATIIREVIARDDANQQTLQSMEYHETLRTERLDGRGRVTQQQELRMIIRPGATQEIQVLSAKGDNLPTDPDQATLQAQGKDAQNKKISFALKDMAARFHITYVGMRAFHGQTAWFMAFDPKPDQPYRDQTEKVLNQLHGHMWISTRDYSVLRTEATLAQPVEIAWIFVEVTALDFHYELDNTSGGLGPALIRTSVKVDAPFITFWQRMTVEMTQFQPR